jgi:protein involved in polysaccharide export with SLBB domain
MKAGEGWSTWESLRIGWMLTLLLGVTGCATGRANVEKNLMADTNTGRSAGVSEHYLVSSPDVLEVSLSNRPELTGTYFIEADGRIDLGDYGRPRVEGQSLAEVARLLASEIGTAPEQVQVRVAEFRSQYLLLFGQVIGWQRTVPYQGQETVLDLLQRVGGITPGAEPDDIYVVRSHLGECQRPEVFHVDLRAIVMKRDEKTNIRLLPLDQVYVGSTRQVDVEKFIPPWLRPLYQTFWDTRPRPAVPRQATAVSRWVAGPHLGTAEVEQTAEH